MNVVAARTGAKSILGNCMVKIISALGEKINPKKLYNIINLKDQKLTEIMFSSLKADSSLFKEEEWLKAGDFAYEIRFFPHAFQCYQRASEINKSEATLRKLNDIVDKITNVLELVPEKLKVDLEEIRLSNPLDPGKWLAIANKFLKEYSDELSQNKVEASSKEAAEFALAFTIYCAKRSGNSITEMNKVLQDLVADKAKFASKKFNLTKLSQNKNGESIKFVCFGDNISLGLMPDWSINFSETYHYLWSKELNTKITLANNSISGAGVLDLCLYAQRDILNYKADVVLLMLGNVDAWLEEETALAFQVLYSAMLKLIKASGVEPIVISPIPQIMNKTPDTDIPPGLSKDDYKIESFVKAAQAAALENEVCFVDAYCNFPQNENYYANQYSLPNLEGQLEIKKALLKETI